MSDAEPDANLPDADAADVGHMAASELPEPFADPPELPSVESSADSDNAAPAKYKSYLQMAGVFAVCLYVVATTSMLMTRPTETKVVPKAKQVSKAASEIAADVSPKLEEADSRVRSSDYGEALRIYERIAKLETGPDSIPVQYRIGLCQEALGNYEEAIDRYRDLVTSDPSENLRWVSRVSQARAWLRNRKSDRARQLLGGLLAEEPPTDIARRPVVAEAYYLFALATPHLAERPAQAPGEPAVARAPVNWPIEEVLLWVDRQPESPANPQVRRRTNERENAVSDLPIGRIVAIPKSEYSMAELFAEIAKSANYKLEISSNLATQLSERKLSVGSSGMPIAVWLSTIAAAADCDWSLVGDELRLVASREGTPKIDPVAKDAYNSAHGIVSELALRLALDFNSTHRLAPTARLDVGNLYYARKQYAQALVEYQELLRTSVSSTSLAATYNVGLVFQKMGRFDSARAALYRVVDGSPENTMAAVAAYLIGRMYLDEGLHQDAVASLEFAARAEMPDDSRAAATVYAAIAHLLGDNYHEAGAILFASRQSFQKTHSLRDAAAFLNSYARFQTLAGNAELQRRETVYLFRSLFALGSDATWLGPYGMLLVGRAYRDLGMKAQMSRVFERSLNEGATGITAAEMRFLLLEARLEKDEAGATARDDMLRFAAAEFDNKWGQRARLTIARMDFEKKRYNDCVQGCRELVNASHIESFVLLRLMGQAYESLNQHRNAALCFAGQVPPQS